MYVNFRLKDGSFFVVNIQKQHGRTTFGTTERIVSERKQNGLPPVLNGTLKTCGQLHGRNKINNLREIKGNPFLPMNVGKGS